MTKLALPSLLRERILCLCQHVMIISGTLTYKIIILKA
jgi:hypothetical protein